MKIKTMDFISNVSYTLTANIITLLISILVISILPKLMGVSEYSYFQLYIFYTSYVVFFHLGLPNGIYLRYGGKEFSELNQGQYRIQFWILVLFTFFISMSGSIYFILHFGITNKSYIFIMTCICGLLVLPRDYILLTFQATNRLKDYGKATLIDRMIFLSLVSFFLIIGKRDYTLLIHADLSGKGITLFWLLLKCRKTLFQRLSELRQGWMELCRNISAGSKLMITNIFDMMIIGIIRIGIEDYWDIDTFGKISFTLSISNLLMTMIQAISLVIFPILRRTDQKDTRKIYQLLRNILIIPMLGALIVFYPVKELLSSWLPEYRDSLSYTALLFPICIYESKMILLISTNLKNIRKEKLLLFINLCTVLVSLLCSILSIYILHNLTLTMLSLVLILAVRCIVAELILSRLLRISVIRDILLELFLCFVFMLTGWFLHSILSTLLYIVAYVIYLWIKKTDMKATIRELKERF